MKTLISFCFVTILTSHIVQSQPIDGNWGLWSNITQCSSTCDDGVQTRNRTCDSPTPSNRGKDCIGSNNETLLCNEGPCYIFTGNWSSWSNYSSCSVTCGSGYSFRNRTCDRTDGKHAKKAVCNGSDSEKVSCNEGQCPPINGSWSTWSNFSDCSLTCGGGIQLRTRTCDSPTPQNGGLYCKGTNITSRACNEDGCPGFDSKGRKFIFGFMRNNNPMIDDLIIFLTTSYHENITVTVTTPLFDNKFMRKVNVTKGHVVHVLLNRNLSPEMGSIEKKGILIEAEKDIVVYGANKEPASTDALVVLPIDAIGQEYYVTSWNEETAFLITGTEDNTDVSIKFGKKSPTIVYDGQTYIPQVDTFKININKFETFYIMYQYGDFTGTHVFGTKPVTLLAGSQCARIGLGGCDHIFQQILPVDKLGTDFITVGMPNCIAEDTFRIVSSRSKTVVNISGLPSVQLNDPGDFFTFNLPDGDARTVTADKGIQLTFFANGRCDIHSMGDAAMVFLPSIQQFSSDYTFSTVILDVYDFINSLTLVIAESFITGLRLDGKMLPNTTWKSVIGRTDIKYTDVIISSGPHSVYHVNPTVTFLAMSTGIQIANSYGYPVGFDFQRNVEDCNNSTMNGNRKSACNINLDPCASVHCLNNGTCNPQGWTNFECSCAKNYGGQLCEIDLCQPHPSDVLFLMDSSRSIGSRHFEIQKQFIINLMSNWTLNSDNFDVAVMSVSQSTILEYDFGVFNNETDLAAEISKLEFKNGSSKIHLGINDAMKIMKSRTRSVHNVNVKKYIILFTDGLPSSPRDVITYTEKDVTIYTVAVGKDISYFYLEKMFGSFSNVFNPFNNRLQNHMLSDLIHPDCGVCVTSKENDVILLVDTSSNLDKDDVRTHIPEVLELLLNKIENKGVEPRSPQNSPKIQF